MEEKKRSEKGDMKFGSISAEKLRADYERKPQPMKPVTVRLDDFKKNLNEVVAGSELPPFLLEMALGEMLSGISEVARREYAQDREAWEKACGEGEENG